MPALPFSLQPSQLCFMTEGTVTPKELFCMERKVLRLLGFELHYANPVALLHLLAEVGHASPEVRGLGGECLPAHGGFLLPHVSGVGALPPQHAQKHGSW